MLPLRLDTHNGDAVTDIVANAAMGQIPGAEAVYVFGRNPNVPNGTTGMIWGLDNTFSNTGIYQANAVNCYISSSSALDVGIVLKVTIIDEEWNRQQLGVVLNGQTAILLAIQARRVLSIENMDDTRFVGNIYAGTSSTPTLGVQLIENTMQYASADEQVSLSAFYTVPKGKTLLITEMSGGTPTNDAVIIIGNYSNPGTNVFKVGAYLPVYRTQRDQSVPFFKLQEMTDIYLSAKALTTNMEAYGTLIGLLVDSEYIA